MFLEQHGQVALPLSGRGVDLEEYLHRLIACYNDWFQTLLARALGPEGTADRQRTVDRRTSLTEKQRLADQQWERSKAHWTAMVAADRASALAPFELTTAVGRSRVMNASQRKLVLTDKPYGPYLERQIQWAVRGGSAMSMGTMVGRSLNRSGFGIGVYLHHTPLIRVTQYVQRLLHRTFGVRFFVGGRPHLLFKVGGGSGLHAHHDRQRPYELLLDCLDNILESPARPNHRWLMQHGIQTLVHLKGATDSGNTYTLANMNPWKLLICLLLVHHQCPHADMRFPKTLVLSKWWTSPGSVGPVHFQWNSPANLAVMNRVVGLLQTMRTQRTQALPVSATPADVQWYHRMVQNFAGFSHKQRGVLEAILGCTSPVNEQHMRVLPIRRLPSDDPSQSQYLAVWLTGFFHGSLPSNTDRLTIVPHLSTRPLAAAEADRLGTYQLKAAEFAQAVRDNNEGQQRSILQWWEQHRRPEQGGPAHERVITELELIGSAFHSLAPTVPEAISFRQLLLQQQQQQQQQHPPPAAAVRQWRLLSIDAPWAQLVADGLKPVENRPWQTARQVSAGQWLAIHVTLKTAPDTSQYAHVPPSYSALRDRRGGHIIALARVGKVVSNAEALRSPELVEWVDRRDGQHCIVWDRVLRLHVPIAVTGGQGFPVLTDAPVRRFTGKTPKTPAQLQKAQRISTERRSADDRIRSSVQSSRYDVVRST